jgi:hypothetical protein
VRSFAKSQPIGEAATARELLAFRGKLRVSRREVSKSGSQHWIARKYPRLQIAGSMICSSCRLPFHGSDAVALVEQADWFDCQHFGFRPHQTSPMHQGRRHWNGPLAATGRCGVRLVGDLQREPGWFLRLRASLLERFRRRSSVRSGGCADGIHAGHWALDLVVSFPQVAASGRFVAARPQYDETVVSTPVITRGSQA